MLHISYMLMYIFKVTTAYGLDKNLQNIKNIVSHAVQYYTNFIIHG
jgi:hypothetical protein